MRSTNSLFNVFRGPAGHSGLQYLYNPQARLRKRKLAELYMSSHITISSIVPTETLW